MHAGERWGMLAGAGELWRQIVFNYVELDQIELERSVSWQWETGKGDFVIGSMSGRGCVAFGGEKDGIEEEGFFVADVQETDGRE